MNGSTSSRDITGERCTLVCDESERVCLSLRKFRKVISWPVSIKSTRPEVGKANIQLNIL